ncbi:MAG: hypothetical protein M1831_006682 [Alyxoria varia]|nr:MAG: hypothetical protein M1831_006682 [Alyxoria varia]
MAASGESNHALVFGASGVSGWAITKELLSYPDKSKFRQVTALTNRPLSLEDSALPPDSRIELASGVDLTQSVEDVMNNLRSKTKNINTVTHVFFTAYIEKGDYQSLVDINTQLLRTAISAVDQVAPKLQAVILQTGGKYYGVEFAGELEIKPPLKETKPRAPSPYKEKIFYYNQIDALKEMSAKRSWSFTEVRPDVIVGFTPGSNYMNVTQGLGFYLSLYREVHGKGAEVPFPGTPKSWKNKHTDTYQDILARLEIHAALNQDKCGGGRAFNAADGQVTTWSELWSGLCEYFGLVGAGPGAEALSLDGLQGFATENRGVWEKVEKERGLKAGLLEKYSWGFLWGVMVGFDFDREFELNACREVGFTDTIPTLQGYTTSFERMREAKIIP